MKVWLKLINFLELYNSFLSLFIVFIFHQHIFKRWIQIILLGILVSIVWLLRYSLLILRLIQFFVRILFLLIKLYGHYQCEWPITNLFVYQIRQVKQKSSQIWTLKLVVSLSFCLWINFYCIYRTMDWQLLK